MTSTPFAVEAGMSILSTPTPARPITLSFGACCKSSGVTLVALRTTSPSYSPIHAFNSSSVRVPGCTALIPRCSKTCLQTESTLSRRSTENDMMRLRESY